jgi:hypothetical protein
MEDRELVKEMNLLRFPITDDKGEKFDFYMSPHTASIATARTGTSAKRRPTRSALTARCARPTTTASTTRSTTRRPCPCPIPASPALTASARHGIRTPKPPAHAPARPMTDARTQSAALGLNIPCS